MEKSFFARMQESIWGVDETDADNKKARRKRICKIVAIVFVVLLVLAGITVLILHFALGLFDKQKQEQGLTNEETPQIGLGFNLPKSSVFTLGNGVKWVQGDVSKCVKEGDYGELDYHESFMKSTTEMLEKTSTQFSMSGSYSKGYTLGGSLNYVSSAYESSKKNAQSYVRWYSRPYVQADLDRSCFSDLGIDTHLNESFHSLPLLIKNPEVRNSWAPYDSIFDGFGTHLATQEFYGARYSHWSSASEDSELSEEDIKFAGCADFGGNVKEGQDNVNACAGYENSSLSNTVAETVQIQHQVVGGSENQQTDVRQVQKKPRTPPQTFE